MSCTCALILLGQEEVAEMRQQLNHFADDLGEMKGAMEQLQATSSVSGGVKKRTRVPKDLSVG